MERKRKILIGYIVNGFAGGVDKYILNLVSSVDLEMFDIDILTNKIEPELVERLKKYNITLYEVPTLKHPVKQYKRIKEIIKENKYEVTYFNISTAIQCLGILASDKCHVDNCVVHSHSSGVDIENNIKRRFMKMLHFLCKGVVSKKATSFIACSQKAGEWMYTRHVLEGKKYTVVHNSADTERYIFNTDIRDSMRKKMKWDDKNVIIHVANFTYQKNNEFMMDVFREAYKRNSNLVLVLIGKGPKEDRIKNMVTQYGVEDAVVFLKDISNVNEYLQAADLFVLPSLFEGYPISALEAQVSGLPCLLSERITGESKLIDQCDFLPLKKELWIQKILSFQKNENRNIVIDSEKLDNKDLSKMIEKIWCGNAL